LDSWEDLWNVSGVRPGDSSRIILVRACRFSSQRKKRVLRIVEDRLTELSKLCTEFRVRRLELFGSAVSGEFELGSSDLDFLVEFEPMEPSEYAAAYFGLHEALAELLHRPVDLVVMTAIDNPYFLRAIEPSRTLLYAA
jgi:predicted nucleotidyltransferase